MFDKDNISPERQYNITFEVTNDEQKVAKFLGSYNHSGFSCNILAGFFELVKNEALKHHFINDEEKEFKNISGILYSHFKLEDTNESGTLEDTIKEFIEDLESKEFYIPSELVGENKDGLTDLGSDVGLEYYFCQLDILLSKIKFAIKSLRDEKLEFWNNLLIKYREDKEAFDYEFKMSKLRTKDMEERVSKITSEDFNDLMGDRNLE